MLSQPPVIDATPRAPRCEVLEPPGEMPQVATAAGTLVVDLAGGIGFEFIAREMLPPASALLVSDRRPTGWPGAWIACDEPVSPAESPGRSEHRPEPGEGLFSRVVVFLPPRPALPHVAVIDRCVSAGGRSDACVVCVVSSLRAHFGDTELAAFEDSVIACCKKVGARTVLLRAGTLLDASPRSRTLWARFAAWHPLVPARIASVFLSREELFSAVDHVSRTNSGARHRRLTLLGRHRPLRDVLAEHCRPGAATSCIAAAAGLLSWLQVGRLAGVAFAAAARFRPELQQWHFSTLRPHSVEELLGFYHPLNRQHVALAGYNTGVTHFGWKYPGKTVVSTAGCGRLVRIGKRTVTVDAGVLLKRVICELRERGKELDVVPNYSYVSLGTAFMVPVHGSGSEVSTLGESIEQVVIYDPANERIVRIRRADPQFGRCMYNPASGVLVLRLRLRIREKSRYFVRRSRLESPSAAEIWQTLSNPGASNVELRKSRAAGSSVEVSKYDTTCCDDPETLEIPRDSIGRVWDRLEETPVASWLFHTYVRKFGFHVELFLDEREFEVFWRLHGALPLSKLQLRFVKCDSLPCSPFGDRDRISIDIFMRRRNSAAFLSVMKEHLPHARFNPGKHSM
jgi:hypothetical protein